MVKRWRDLRARGKLSADDLRRIDAAVAADLDALMRQDAARSRAQALVAYSDGCGVVSFDNGATWHAAPVAAVVRGLCALGGMVGHVPTVTVTAVDHEARTITVSGGDR